MYTYAGIWIDHAKAFIIKSNKMAEMSLESLESSVEPHHKGGIESDEHQTIANQRAHDERRHNQLNAFCEEILAHLGEVDELVIFGPGTAKHEMEHELKQHKALYVKLKGLETTDKMTEAQLKEFMKTYFALPKD